MTDYITYYLADSLQLLAMRETDLEFDPVLWRDDPDMDLDARACRDLELMLDITGNLDSSA